MKNSNSQNVIDMNKYLDSKPVVEQCTGCNRIFDFEWQDGFATIEAKKCLVYIDPAVKWPRKGEQFATRVATVVERDARGKIISRENKEVPIIEKVCPMASHVKVAERIVQTSKVLVGQQKQKKKR